MTAEVGVRRYINQSIETRSYVNPYWHHLDLGTDVGRLRTYCNWPNKKIDPKKLATAGFFYYERSDNVQCFKCGIQGHNWLEDDEPLEDHLKWNEDCPFAKAKATEKDNASQSTPGRDYCGNFDVENLSSTETEELQNYSNCDAEIFPKTSILAKLGIQKKKLPSHPDYVTFDSRLKTYKDWPMSLKQKPKELADTGFYYLGVGDQTMCFFCGGGLKDWVEEDDPWEQHALWFPKCNYLLLKKTSAFVEDVQTKFKKSFSFNQGESEETSICSNGENPKKPPIKTAEKIEKNKENENSTLCKICYKNELAVVFLPCGHMVACVDCASGLKECAICRKDIQASVRVFLA